jgi:HSP20 family protein
MNLIPRDTWRDMDKVFDTFFTPGLPSSRFVLDNDKTFFSPQVDIVDKNDHYEIKADLPGVKKEDLKVNLENGILSIEANHKEEKSEEKDGKVIRKERRTGHFMRSFSLGENVQDKDIKADFKDGVLTIIAPKLKPETPKPRQISIG